MLCNYGYIMIIYCFDFKSENYKRYNTVKRRFYYGLKKMGVLNNFFRTKSVISVEESKEIEVDAFFELFKEDIVLFKGRIANLERVY